MSTNNRRVNKVMLLLSVLFMSVNIFAQEQIVVNSIKDLLPYLKQNNVQVTLAPGIYNLSETDVKSGLISNPILKFEGNNNTYDFKGVTINFNTNLLTAFGSVDVRNIRILGNDNILKNLTMVDDGKVTDAPTKRAQSIVIDGARNKVEGFYLTVKGSYPYGYGEVFGKGGKFVVRHRSEIPMPTFTQGSSLEPMMKHPKSEGHTAVAYTSGATTIRTDQYRFIQHCSGEQELYDHVNAPSETINIASDYPELVQEFRKLLEAKLDYAFNCNP